MGATGIGLAAWLRNPAQEELVRDKRVLELGCGCGLPGIAYYLVQWDIVYFNGTLFISMGHYYLHRKLRVHMGLAGAGLLISSTKFS